MAKLLVADDDPGVRGVIEVALDGHRMTFAQDGAGALALLARERYDLVLLDVMMPVLDGMETLRRIRMDPRTAEVPVIMLTARVSEDDHLRGYAAGADAYVTKPFDPDDLERTIDEVLGRSLEVRRSFREAEKAKAALLRHVERRFA